MKFKEYLKYHDVDVDVGTDITEHELEIIIPPPSNFKHEEVKDESSPNVQHIFTNTTGHLTTEIYLYEPLKSAFIVQIDDRKEPPMDKTIYEISDAPPYFYI